MPIKGLLESVSGTAITGWCIDTSHDGIVDVELRIGSVSLGSVHADLHRADLAEKWNRTTGGFRFRVSPRLLSLLPAGERVEAWANGQLLGYKVSCEPCFEGATETSTAKLEELLGDGYFISPKSGSVRPRVTRRWSPDRVFRSISDCNAVLEDRIGRSLFICYGTLLGCIRANDFIEHDDDVDVCFLSEADSAPAAAEDFASVLQVLRRSGEKVHWPGNAHFHWNLLDVFIAWFEDGALYMYNAGGECAKDAVLPLRSRDFLGRDVLVPNDAEKVLEIIYGPSWRIPDPMFQWRVVPEVRRKLKLFEERLSQLLE